MTEDESSVMPFMKIFPSSKTSVFVLLIIAITISAYSFAIQGAFKTLDDEKIIITNPDIRSFSRVGHIFTSSFFGRQSYYRPLVTFSHLLEYQAFGLKAPFYYLINILIHTASALILFALLRRILQQETLSFLGALLFAVHPVQWEAVTNIPGRAILMAAFFVFLSFYFFCRATRRDCVLSLLMFGCGLMCKESAGIFPLVLVAYRMIIPSGAIFSRRETMSRLRSVIPFFVVAGLYVLIRRWLGITNVFLWRSVPEAVLGFLTFLRGLLTYLRLLIWPLDGHFDRARILFISFRQLELILTVIVFAVVLFFVYRYRRSIPSYFKFFLLWPFIELIPVCQIPFAVGVQPGMISTAEHFLYLPMAGMAGLAVLAGQRLCSKILAWPGRPVSPFVLRWAIVGLYAFLLLFTVQMSIHSHNETVMFERTLRYNPYNSRILTSLAVRYAHAGRLQEAERLFRQALLIDRLDVKARIGLGKVLCDQGQYWQGLAEYDKVEDAGLYAETLETNRRLTRQILLRRLSRACEKNPRDARIHYSLGVIYSQVGNTALARECFEKASEINPGFKAALFNLASLEAAQGETGRAIEHLERLLGRGSPEWIDYMAWQKLEKLYLDTGVEAKALQARQQAESLKRELELP